MSARQQPAGRGFWPLRDLPVVLWLVALVVSTLLHPVLPAPRWLMIHLLLLGAVSHAILVWSTHFAETLLHVPAASRRVQSARLATLDLGAVGVVTGVLSGVWPVTLVGAAGVVVAAAWHGAALGRMVRRALPSRFTPVVRYYVAAACLLPVGGSIGAALARDLPEPWHHRLMLAHVLVNVLGWMGLTVAGTVVTLWPTMLRTRLPEGTDRLARQALPVLLAGVLGGAAASAAGSWRGAAGGVAVYLAGLAMLGRPLVRAGRTKPPTTFATWSVGAGLLWLVGCLVALATALASAPDWEVAGSRLEWVTPLLAAGFGAQVLLGALSYLVPMALGGGPVVTRHTTAAMDRGSALRVTATNAGLVVCALPVPSPVRVAASVVVLVAAAAFVPLLFATLRVRRTAATADALASRTVLQRPQGQRAGLAVTGLAVVLVAVATGAAVDPGALGGSGTGDAAAGVRATGRTTVVRVEAAQMRFSPARITVPAGNRLVIDVANADDHAHDLTLETGQHTPRLAAGEHARLDVGVVGRDLDGWCSIVGHRQQGMVLRVDATGTAAAPAAHQETGQDGRAPTPDFMADPGPDFRSHDATLPPLEKGRVHRRTFTVRDVRTEVAPGVVQTMWTYDGAAPGPILHGRVGDRFVIRLVNHGTMGHSIDFHAGALAPSGPMRTIEPGESLVYRFTARRAGVWMYHCSTMPMSTHIAAGLFGAVVIEPPDLPEVDRSYLLVQSELYLGAQHVDPAKVMAERPDAVVFNGYANQYDHRPLPARVGERVRVWVLDAGPSRATSFHVVGGQFDATYLEGAWRLRRDGGSAGGAQALGLQPAQGGFVELTFPEPGDYPFISHVMVDAERGAHGLFRVSR